MLTKARRNQEHKKERKIKSGQYWRCWVQRYILTSAYRTCTSFYKLRKNTMAEVHKNTRNEKPLRTQRFFLKIQCTESYIAASWFEFKLCRSLSHQPMTPLFCILPILKSFLASTGQWLQEWQGNSHLPLTSNHTTADGFPYEEWATITHLEFLSQVARPQKTSNSKLQHYELRGEPKHKSLGTGP